MEVNRVGNARFVVRLLKIILCGSGSSGREIESYIYDMLNSEKIEAGKREDVQ